MLVPGFLCKITPTGRKVFMVQYRTKLRRAAQARPRPVRRADGRTGPIAGTRLAGRVRAAATPDSTRPRPARRRRSRSCAAGSLDDHSKPHNKPSTQAGYQYQIDSFVIPAFGSKKVHEVTRHDITALMKRMEKSPTQANRVLSLVPQDVQPGRAVGLPARRLESLPPRAQVPGERLDPPHHRRTYGQMLWPIWTRPRPRNWSIRSTCWLSGCNSSSRPACRKSCCCSGIG